MKINTFGKTWWTVKAGAIIQYDVFDEDGQVIGTEHVRTKEDVCVYMESENVEVEGIKCE